MREVLLGPPGAPWVHARTVAPLANMQGQMRSLRNLGAKPLGLVLFNGRKWRRSPFQLGVMVMNKHREPLPARRSLFCDGENRLLITEGFCPAYWQMLEQEQYRRNGLDSSESVLSALLPEAQ